MTNLNSVKRYFDIWYPDGHFISYVEQHLKDNNAENPYKDLDGIEFNPDKATYAYTCKEFYDDLCSYLSKKAELTNMSISFEMDEKDSVPGIVVKDNDKDRSMLFPLKSDQLAFSFNGIASKSNKYPYGNLYNKTKDPADYSFIAECLYDTRTQGASFLWPMVVGKYGKWDTNPNYNMRRGIGSYIEDRVDLTLWEIKEAYDYLKNPKEAEYPNCILIRKIKENDNMKIWLELFDSFENFVDYFSFNPYVAEVKGEYIPIDIVASGVNGSLKKVLTEEHVNKLRENNKKELQSLDSPKEIKRVLENVKLLTLQRSVMMQIN